MRAFQLAIDIRRPPADVFAFIAEPQNMPLWYEAVQQVTKTTANPTGVGAKYDIVRSLPNGPAFNDVEVVEYTLNHEVTIESRSGPTPFRYRYRVEPSQQDTTLTLDGSITSAGLPGPAGHLGGLATPTVQTRHAAKPAPAQAGPRSCEERRSMTGPAQTDLEQTERAHRTRAPNDTPSEQRGRT